VVRLPPAARPLYPYLKPAYTHATRIASPTTRLLSRMRGRQLPIGVAATTEQAAERSGGRWLLASPEQAITRRPPPPGEADAVFAQNLAEVQPRTVVAELPNGRVLGPHSAVISGAGELVQDLSYYFGTTRPREHPLFLHPFPGPPTDVPGRLGVLATRGDVNYYHFLMDVLPRLAIMSMCPGIDPPERWFVPAQSRFQRELLDRFDIPAERRVDSTLVRHVRAECLVVPSPPSMTVINPPWVVAYLRSRLLATPIARVEGRGIYVTRGRSANNRQVLNEDELVTLLAGRGFEIIDPGAMSVAEQIRSFAEASVIVAPHGAALVNLVFAGAGATVIELFPAGHLIPDYWKLANGVDGLDYRYLLGAGATSARSRPQLLVSDITVDLPALAAQLDAVV
jgi:Glycosyltransferase 61